MKGHSHHRHAAAPVSGPSRADAAIAEHIIEALRETAFLRDAMIVTLLVIVLGMQLVTLWDVHAATPTPTFTLSSGVEADTLSSNKTSKTTWCKANPLGAGMGREAQPRNGEDGVQIPTGCHPQTSRSSDRPAQFNSTQLQSEGVVDLDAFYRSHRGRLVTPPAAPFSSPRLPPSAIWQRDEQNGTTLEDEP